MAKFYKRTNEANSEALRLFQQAIELDPDFASAYGMAARCYSQRKSSSWVQDRPHEIAEARRLAPEMAWSVVASAYVRLAHRVHAQRARA